MKLKEISEKIDKHLKRFAADPKINIEIPKGSGLHRYYHPGARPAGRRVMVWYVVYQGSRGISKTQAEKYLAWLDAGNVGDHWEMDRT